MVAEFVVGLVAMILVWNVFTAAVVSAERVVMPAVNAATPSGENKSFPLALSYIVSIKVTNGKYGWRAEPYPLFIDLN